MDWSKLKVTDLKAELKNRGLQANGLKAELVARLESADAEQAEAPADAGAEAAEEAAPETAPSANGDAGAADEPSAEPSGGAGDNGEEMMDAEQTNDVQAEEDAAHNGEDSAQQASTLAAPAAEPPPEPIPEQAPETETKPEPMEADEPGPPGQTDDVTPAAPTTELEKSEVAVAANDVHAPSSPERKEEIQNVAQDIQKRKRSPSSPPPDEADRKRQRGDIEGDVAMEPAKQDESREAVRDEEDTAMEDEPRPSSPDRGTRDDAKLAAPEESAGHAPAPEAEAPSHIAHPTVEPRHFPGIEPSSHAVPEMTEEMDVERDVDPSIHPATSALYIKNFMRPLRAPDVQAHLAHLVNPSGGDTAHDDLEDFFLDQIRTHAFAVFKSVSAASRVRNALHNRVWPDEANRKPLWVDFVPAEKVRGWIETEESQGGSRSSTAKRWTVTYDDGGDSGDVVAHLELDDATSRAPTGPSARGPAPPPPTRPAPKGPAFDSTNMIPLGPRAQRGHEGPPPRPNMPPGRGPPSQPGGTFGTTTARPYVTFRLVSEDLARQRIDDMQSYYTKDYRRDFGKEINRYTFEDGVHFVDRGAEVFEGIRPPHRERERQMERRGGRGGRGRGRGGPRFGGRGPPPFQSRSDRYLPGLTDRDDRPMFGDSPPRHRNDRFEDDYRKDAGRLHFEDDRDVRDDYKNDRDGRF